MSEIHAYPSPDRAPDPIDATADAVPPGRPRAALAELLAGNQRFVADRPRHGHRISAATRVAAEQHPLAVVLGCIDSRVPAEAVFDQDFGSVCVVRSGGHVLDRAVLGSVEFAVAVLRVPLVMVLGHTRCGAVQAAVDAEGTGTRPDGELRYLVDEIAPAVRATAPAAPSGGGDGAVAAATREHVRRTVAALDRLAAVRAPVAAGALGLVGAAYHLDSGTVELLT